MRIPDWDSEAFASSITRNKIRHWDATHLDMYVNWHEKVLSDMFPLPEKIVFPKRKGLGKALPIRRKAYLALEFAHWTRRTLQRYVERDTGYALSDWRDISDEGRFYLGIYVNLENNDWSWDQVRYLYPHPLKPQQAWVRMQHVYESAFGNGWAIWDEPVGLLTVSTESGSLSVS